MKVIVTGSRDFADRQQVWSALDDAYTEGRGLVLIHGACPTGADRHAADWAWMRQHGPYHSSNVMVFPYPANWGKFGRAAGLTRNAEMVNAGADVVLAFYQPGAGNRGTAHCVKLARRAGIEVRRFGGAA